MSPRLPEVGDSVNFNGRAGVITKLLDLEGEVTDPKDALALVVQWEDGTFSGLLLSDLEFVQ
jgi:predicted heme/steroid binding protein